MNRYRKKIMNRITCILAFLMICTNNSKIVAQIFYTSSNDVILFEDNFDSPKEWTMTEEIIDSLVYKSGIGEIALTKMPEDSILRNCFSVWANKEDSIYSNHVIAGNKFLNDPINCHYVYSLYAYIPAYSDTGQTGPEFSVQNTKKVLDTFFTYTAGIQYIPNPHVWTEDSMEKWRFWQKGNQKGDWVPFLNYSLKKGRWYYFELEFKYSDSDSENKYISFKIKDTLAKMDTVFVDLSHFKITSDIKPEFEDEGVSLTLEAENLFTHATRSKQYKVFYDDVRFIKRKDTTECTVQMPTINLNKFCLNQNYPNPFNALTTIRYQMKKAGQVKIEIYDILGQKVKTLVDQQKGAGYYSILWDG
ncbi:MAG: T9SS type A sorting domain-containing protein, partial [Ignavibacteriales bacterium]|nr:T9SS type A sorting domain-containing protein [Ignavibacteriales bacterium]